jgi:predicted RNA binding protein YcfA (HicA-like mRNA interferase family)
LDKDTRKLIKKLEAQGFEVRTTKNGHHQVYKDGRRVTTLAGTSSDWRGRKNAMAQLKRHGFIEK